MTVAEGPQPPDREAEEALEHVRARSDRAVEVAVVLGSGLGDAVAADLESGDEFAYGDLPGFPPPSIPGHAGRLVLGSLYRRAVAVFRGRVHLYEGHGVAATTLIPRLAAGLGASTLVLTNAAGGLHRSMSPGQLMLITDHLNLMPANPLTGWRFPDGTPAFVDLTHVYDPALMAAAHRVAQETGVVLLRGVYAALSGPSYETPAETEMLRRLGADAVGMSTVPEAVAAAALGLRVLAVSCITNVAANEPTHEEVLDAARSASGPLKRVLSGVFATLPPGGRAGEDGDPGRAGAVMPQSST
jgi:purine-nucleoside phosphorylase